MNDKAITISGEENIDRARLIILKGALKLEVVGMKNRGMSAYQIVKKEFGFKGSKQSVLEQLTNYIDSNQ
jgi:hypothetical protein